MNRNWETFGEEIRRTVQNAVENQNYDKLNQAISDTINQAVDAVSEGVRYTKETIRQTSAGRNHSKVYTQSTYEEYRQNSKSRVTTQWDRPERKERKTDWSYQNSGNRKQNYNADTVAVNTMTKVPSKTAAAAVTVSGYTFGGIQLLGCLGSLGAAWLTEAVGAVGGSSMLFHALFGSVLTGISGAAGIMAAAGIGIGIWGQRRWARINRFTAYLEEIGQKEYCDVKKLAAKVKKPTKTVLKDIQYMIEKKWLKQGHMDEQNSCLMITDRMYEQYKQLENQRENQEQAAKEKEAVYAHLTPDVRKIIEQGDVYVKKIRACNDEIPGEEISEKIDRIEMLVDKIFDRVEAQPKCAADIQKMMDYYLPTTIKLLEAYAQMDAQPAGGANIQNSKKEIEATLDTLNTAYEKMLDSLFEEIAWDVSTDISVLNTMLAREGLTEDGLSKAKK